MNMLDFIYNMFAIVSVDILSAFGLFLAWKYLDLKYFSTSEIEQLKAENEYLRKENKKINGTSTEFWKE